jgi:YVTN family beta-propeller protein
MWISSRYHSAVLAIDTTTGKVVARIPTDKEPHGLTYFPNSRGNRSLGHNGVYQLD